VGAQVTFGWQEEFLREERRMREKISSESEGWDLEPSIPMKKRRGEESCTIAFAAR
jgi:hypothetical protein